MKGGHRGVGQHKCPICYDVYDAYAPADSSIELDDESVVRVCSVVQYGNYANGGYIHYK